MDAMTARTQGPRAKVTSDRTKAAYAEIAGAFTVSAWSGPPALVVRVRAHAMTYENDLPAKVRRQDEEDELQIAAQLAELRKEEHVSAARRRWSDLSKRTHMLLITAAVADGALRVAALIDIQRRPASQIRGRKGCGRQPWHWSAPPESCQSHTSSSGSVASPEGRARLSYEQAADLSLGAGNFDARASASGPRTVPWP